MHFSTAWESKAKRGKSATVTNGHHYFAVGATNISEATDALNHAWKKGSQPLTIDHDFDASSHGRYTAGLGFAMLNMDSLGPCTAPDQLKTDIAQTMCLVAALTRRMGIQICSKAVQHKQGTMPAFTINALDLSGSKAVWKKMVDNHWKNVKTKSQTDCISCSIHASTNIQYFHSAARDATIWARKLYPDPESSISKLIQETNAEEGFGCSAHDAWSTLYWIRRNMRDAMREHDSLKEGTSSMLSRLNKIVGRMEKHDKFKDIPQKHLPDIITNRQWEAATDWDRHRSDKEGRDRGLCVDSDAESTSSSTRSSYRPSPAKAILRARKKGQSNTGSGRITRQMSRGKEGSKT
jgi:hypothetical protein